MFFFLNFQFDLHYNSFSKEWKKLTLNTKLTESFFLFSCWMRIFVSELSHVFGSSWITRSLCPGSTKFDLYPFFGIVPRQGTDFRRISHANCVGHWFDTSSCAQLRYTGLENLAISSFGSHSNNCTLHLVHTIAFFLSRANETYIFRCMTVYDVSGWYQNRQDGCWQRGKQRRQIWRWNGSRNTMSVAPGYLEEKNALNRMETFSRTRRRRNRKGNRASRAQSWRNRKPITRWKRKLRICWIRRIRLKNKMFEVRKDESYRIISIDYLLFTFTKIMIHFFQKQVWERSRKI